MDFSCLKCHRPVRENNYPLKMTADLQRHAYQTLETAAGSRNCKLVSVFARGRQCHFSLKTCLITKEHFSVVPSQGFLVASPCRGIKSEPRGPCSSPVAHALCVCGSPPERRRGAMAGITVQHVDSWALSAVAGASWLHMEKVGQVDLKAP